MKNKSLLSFAGLIVVACVTLSFILKSPAQKRAEKKMLLSAESAKSPSPIPILPKAPDAVQIDESPKQKEEFNPRQALESAPDKKAILGVLAQWVQSNPQAAAQYARAHALDGIQGVSNAATVANYLAAIDPEAAKAFAESIPEDRGARNMAIIDAAMKLAYDNPAGTAEWIARVLPTKNAIQVVMAQYAVQDPEGAVRWVDSLEGPAHDYAQTALELAMRKK